MKKGDWVASREELGSWTNQPQFGKVREVYGDLMDVVLYDTEGEKVGRESDPLDGPTEFEPCLPCADWVVIQKPKFPLPRYSWGASLLAVEESHE
jgi:hypothetical protein